jgi:hypothetical protein
MNIFQETDLYPISLADWLEWASGKNDEMFVALPMIQRGSVWKPHQIIDLWDSLLQGMPIGSMMVSELPGGTPVRRLGKGEHERVLPGDGLGLIDGQQRTLAMLIAWPQAEWMDRRVWLDFADEPAPGQLLRLRVTTKNHYFGFQRNEPSRKLSLDDRRKAYEAFKALCGEEEPNLDNAWPFSHNPGLPVDLRWLIKLWREKSDTKHWLSLVNERLRHLQGAKFIHLRDQRGAIHKWTKVTVWDTLEECRKSQISELVQTLPAALECLDRLKIPLIRVNPRFLDPKSNKGGDPLLAVLFKRIGSGGTPLSNEDYVYSVIKHLRPETFDLVEMLHQKPTVANLLTATDLVMSAVRLAAVTWKPEDDKPVQDMESPNKRDFNRLLERGDFINEFLQLIQADRGAAIATYFDQVQDMLHYRGDSDIGLPKQVFPLLGRPLVQVLLRLAQVGYLNKVEDMARRKDVLRLVLFWLIAVSNESKASRLAYDVIKEQCGSNIELGRAIYDQLVSEGAAFDFLHQMRLRTGQDWLFQQMRQISCAVRLASFRTSMEETHRHTTSIANVGGVHGLIDTPFCSGCNERWWRTSSTPRPIRWRARTRIRPMTTIISCPPHTGKTGREKRRVTGFSISRKKSKSGS